MRRAQLALRILCYYAVSCTAFDLTIDTINSVLIMLTKPASCVFGNHFSGSAGMLLTSSHVLWVGFVIVRAGCASSILHNLLSFPTGRNDTSLQLLRDISFGVPRAGEALAEFGDVLETSAVWFDTLVFIC